MNAQDALDAIDTMDADQLNEAIRRIKDRRGVLSKRQVRKFQAGDIVVYEYNGSSFRAEVVKPNRKTVTVRNLPDGSTYRVQGTMLRAAD